jgi:pimeloyl-ACP methyl ester carboxylesterase
LTRRGVRRIIASTNDAPDSTKGWSETMPTAFVNGVNLNYETLGSSGPWVALTGGGRSDLSSVKALGKLIADAGYRVLLHDRRNTGASDVSIDGDEPEQVQWADDLYELLRGLGALPVFCGGGSAGCRLSLLLAKRHPEAVSGLLCWRPSGGPWAGQYLAGSNYGDFIEAVKRGGMQAVIETPFMQERIAANPGNRERLAAMDPRRFLAVMERNHAFFVDGGELPLIGFTADELRGITAPACIVAGQDDCHPRPLSDALPGLMPNIELVYLHTEAEVAAIKAAGGYPGAYATVSETPQELAACSCPSWSASRPRGCNGAV